MGFCSFKGAGFMAQLKLLHVISTGILIIGILGIIFGLITGPEKFPVVALFLAALGILLSVAVSTKYYMWKNYEN